MSENGILENGASKGHHQVYRVALTGGKKQNLYRPVGRLCTVYTSVNILHIVFFVLQ